MEYKVAKQHWGDKQYHEGDTREVKVKGDADQLVAMGLIVDSKAAAEKAKAEAKAQAEKEKADAKAKAQADEEAEERAIEADEAKDGAEKAATKPKNKMAKEVANKSE